MKRVLVIILSFTFIVVRAALPTFRLDEISLALFIIICLAIFWSDVGKIGTQIRKFRLGDFELELAEQVQKLSEKAERTEEAESQNETGQGRVQELPPEVAKRIAEAGTDPRSALLLTAIEIENAVRRLAREYDLTESKPIIQLIENLAYSGAISKEVVNLFREFWNVRNHVIHDAGFDIPAGQIYSLVDVGVKILRLLAAARRANG